MKKLLLCTAAALLAFSLAGCGGNAPAAEATAPADTEATTVIAVQTAPQPDAIENSQPESQDGQLFLKASSVTLSLVGETDDIYLGTVPRESVSWESDDESVATFVDGVLTATGVGTTTVRACYGDQQIECAVGCLAQTQEELEALDDTILRAPKRLPPAVDMSETCTDFTDSVIIGDSITYFMFQWESKYNYLGDVLFMARGGISLNGFVDYYKNVYYRGAEMRVEDAIAESGVKKVYLMLGQNDLTSRARVEIMDNWVVLLSRIREKSPDVEIYIQSCIPELSLEDRLNEKNQRIFDYNETLRAFAQENDCHFIDLCYYIVDHQGKMPECYSQGNYHMNEAGCCAWMQLLRFYARLELEGGDLS